MLGSCANDPVEEQTSMDPEMVLGDVRFYLDNSESMAGYFASQAEFKTIISDLMIKVDKNIKPVDVWLISEEELKYPASAQNFISGMATMQYASKDGYQLYEMISRIAAKSDSNDISFLISDCILSFPSDKIKVNSEINREGAPTALKSNVFSTFSDLKNKGFVTTIYAFNSKFYGYYYDYQNTKQRLNGTKRPFYIWVIGHKELLPDFNAQLLKISTFKPDQYLNFGSLEKAVTEFRIIPQLGTAGDWSRDAEKSGLQNIKLSEGKPIQFTFGIDLNNLPHFAQSVQYLQDNIKLDNQGCSSLMRVKEKRQVDKSKIKSQRQLEDFEKSTHFITVTVSEMNLNEAKIRLSMPVKYDNWYLDWSVDDDRSFSAAENKTFAFHHLISGVREAYESDNKSFIDITVSLSK